MSHIDKILSEFLLGEEGGGPFSIWGKRLLRTIYYGLYIYIYIYIYVLVSTILYTIRDILYTMYFVLCSIYYIRYTVYLHTVLLYVLFYILFRIPYNYVLYTVYYPISYTILDCAVLWYGILYDTMRHHKYCTILYDIFVTIRCYTNGSSILLHYTIPCHTIPYVLFCIDSFCTITYFVIPRYFLYALLQP